MGISSQRLDDGLFMFGHIFLMISTIITVAIFIAKYFFLKAFAIKFEAFGSLTVAAKFLFCDHIVLLFVDGRL